MKNEKETRTSNKLKRLKRINEEKEQRQEGKRFGEEFSEEPLTERQLKEDLPTEDI